jgi:hypothetical protein
VASVEVFIAVGHRAGAQATFIDPHSKPIDLTQA